MSPDQNTRIPNDRAEQQNDGQPKALKPWTAPRLLKQKDCAGKGVYAPGEFSTYAGPS